jgi:hypothetical protein
LFQIFENLIREPEYREKLGKINEIYIKNHLGATQIILDFIHDKVQDIS